MAMVKFLVEECGADVNGMDVVDGQRLPNHWGTPAAYAVHANWEKGDRGREVVGWLLEVSCVWLSYFVMYGVPERKGVSDLDVVLEGRGSED